MSEKGPSLHASEERFRLLVESVKDYAIFILDPAGIVETWNSGAQRIKGYRADEIIGQHFSKFYRPEDQWKCARELEIATREGRVEDEGWRVKKDGSLFWGIVVITCLRADDGTIVGFAKVTRDMTGRREAEEVLRESEERFRLLVESVKDYAIFMLDAQGKVATWNAGAERIKGYRADEIIGQHFARFYPDEDVRAGKCEMELELATREGRFEDEGWRLRKDGSRFWANVVITALRNKGGTLVGFAKVTRDLTERRQAEEDRESLTKLARQRVELLGKLAEVLVSTTTTHDVTTAVIEQVMRITDADTCTLYVLDAQTMTLDLVAERGCNPDILPHILHLRPDSGNPSYDVGVGKSAAMWVETPEEYASHVPAVAALPSERPRAQAWWCVPISAEGRVIGMIGVGYHAARRFTPDERAFIGTFTQQCGQALARANRFELAERLRSSLATTLRSIGDAVIATDPSGSVTLMNAVAETLTGWKESDAIGHPLSEVFHIVNEQTRATVVSPVDRVLETGGVVGLANHTILVARDGREVPIDDSGAPIRGQSGVLEGVVLVFRDVTERKSQEAQTVFLADATAALAESLAYEDTVAKVARLAVPRLADWCAVDLVLDSQTPKRLAVAHVDPAKVALAHELYAKYPPRREATTGIYNVLRTGKSELYPEIPEAMLSAAAVDEEHLRIMRELRLASAMVVPLLAGGRVLGAITFVHGESGRRYTPDDVAFAEEVARRCAMAIENARLFTSEQRARKAADEANRAKDEFLAVVSHELRTPLNAIMGWSKLLSRHAFDDAARNQRAIETIERNSVSMAQLIDDLLDMSRVISGKMRLEVQQVDVVKIVETAIESILPAATAKEIRISSDFDNDLPPLMADPTRLQQIVWNLLSNAVKFTSKSGVVHVDVRAVESSLEVVVADNGKGIAPDFFPRVFEAFRQEDASTTRSRGGLGLGLAITRQLVELHGGHIQVESEGEGRGAKFTVRLPVTAVPVSRAPRKLEASVATKYERPAHLAGLQVLVVDDDDDARRLVSIVLEDCGCLVRSASNVAEAMARFAERVPDVLLSDIGMPEHDGYELIRRVRALPRQDGADIPAAALTAYASAEDRRRLLNAGFSMHLAKPIEPAELVAVVATLTRFIHRSDEPPRSARS